ncbi:MAG: MOSC domain-containing protein [Pseudomonadota bacterium]
MPALTPTDIVGKIEWLGVVADRDAALASTHHDNLMMTFAGPAGEAHGGTTRPSCSRVTAQYPKGTTIRNVRQLSVLSSEELAEIADRIGVTQFDPAWAGATLILSGIPDFSHIPPSSRLQNEATGATIVVDMQNRPCHLPAKVIEGAAPGHGKAFKEAAQGRRGVTAWVEREGTMAVGDPIRLHIPDQRAWQGRR